MSLRSFIRRSIISEESSSLPARYEGIDDLVTILDPVSLLKYHEAIVAEAMKKDTFNDDVFKVTTVFSCTSNEIPIVQSFIAEIYQSFNDAFLERNSFVPFNQNLNAHSTSNTSSIRESHPRFIATPTIRINIETLAEIDRLMKANIIGVVKIIFQQNDCVSTLTNLPGSKLPHRHGSFKLAVTYTDEPYYFRPLKQFQTIISVMIESINMFYKYVIVLSVRNGEKLFRCNTLSETYHIMLNEIVHFDCDTFFLQTVYPLPRMNCVLYIRIRYCLTNLFVSLDVANLSLNVIERIRIAFQESRLKKPLSTRNVDEIIKDCIKKTHQSHSSRYDLYVSLLNVKMKSLPCNLTYDDLKKFHRTEFI